jgi:hypothetical protein
MRRESENLYLCKLRAVGQLRAIRPRLPSLQIDGDTDVALGTNRAAAQ